jgi:hypothetical protein
MADNFRLNEGPVWVPQVTSGFLLVSGLLDNVLYRVDLDGKVSGSWRKPTTPATIR